MRALFIQETVSTPKIELNPTEKKFFIRGISMPEDPTSFYDDVISWIDEYKESPFKGLKLAIQLEYFNSSSALVLVGIMQQISKVGSRNKIIWEYKSGDEDLKEAGEEYQKIIGNQLVLKEV